MAERMMADTDPAKAVQPSKLMNDLMQLRGTSLELRSKLNAVLERPSPEVENSDKALDGKALDIIADTQDILNDIHDRLVT